MTARKGRCAWITVGQGSPGEFRMTVGSGRGSRVLGERADQKALAVATDGVPTSYPKFRVGPTRVLKSATGVADSNAAPVFVYSQRHGGSHDRRAGRYIVDAVTPGRAIHGLEVNFVLGSNFAAPSNHVLTPADVSLSGAMSTFWASLRRNRRPQPSRCADSVAPRPSRSFQDRGVDPSQSDRHFVFVDRAGVATYLRDPHSNFWEPFFFRSVGGVVPAAARCGGAR